MLHIAQVSGVVQKLIHLFDKIYLFTILFIEYTPRVSISFALNIMTSRFVLASVNDNDDYASDLIFAFCSQQNGIDANPIGSGSNMLRMPNVPIACGGAK